MWLFLFCLLLPLGGGGVLSTTTTTLQMDKDMQYNCYYQILKNFSRKSYDDYEDEIDFNEDITETVPSSSSLAWSSTESPLIRKRRELFKDHEERSSIQDFGHINDLEKTFSSAYAEPRNSGNYRESFKPAGRYSIDKNHDKSFNSNNDSLIATAGAKEMTYFIVASRTLRAGFIYSISISVLEAKHPIKAFANISCDGVSNISGAAIDVYAGGSETMKLYVPTKALPRRACKLRLEGFFLNYYCDLAFLDEFALDFVQDSRMILIETDKPLYKQADVLRFRVTVLSMDYKPSECIVEVFLKDPNEHVTWRWLTPVPPSGTITLNYTLSDRPVFGEWTINVAIAEQGGQQKRIHFTLEEYYQPHCEIEIDMAPIFYTTSAYIKGNVRAMRTNNALEPIYGNLTLLANYYPLGHLNGTELNAQFRLNHPNDKQFYVNAEEELFKHSIEVLNRSAYVLHKNQRSTSGYGSTTTTYFMSHKRRLYQEAVTEFNGSYSFKWSKFDLEKLQANMTAVEILVTATVTTADDRSELCSGYAIARIYKPTMRITYLGGTAQIFKPNLPFTIYIALDYINGSPLDSSLLTEGVMEVRGVISTKSKAGKFTWPKQRLPMLQHRTGIWELKIDLRNDFPHIQRDILHTVTEMLLQATFTVERQAGTKRAHNTTTTAALLLKAHFSPPRNHYIKVSTSTEQPTVGEYIIFQINTNFHVEHFHYMVIAKQVILVSEREYLTDGMRTIALVLSAEMSPVAEIFVWATTWQGQIVADSLVFPVIGMFRSNFTLTFDHLPHENKLVAHIRGEPGSHVSLTGIGRELYYLQGSTGFGLSQERFINEMRVAYNSPSRLLRHSWYMPKDHKDAYGGNWLKLYYPAATAAIDANSCFIQSGLLVLTDGLVPGAAPHCNANGFGKCLQDGCFLLAKRCDAVADCADGSDEMGCGKLNQHQSDFYERQLYRVNRVLSHYQNASWMWQDIQINSTGLYSFYVDEPVNVNANQWLINGYSTRQLWGLGELSKPVLYSSSKPLIARVDMPAYCRQYEQIGIYVYLQKNSNTTLMAKVKLGRSSDYVGVKTKQIQHPLKFSVREEQRTLVLAFKPMGVGKIPIILSVETPIDSFNLTSFINVKPAEDNLEQQQRGWHKSLVVNLTQQQNQIMEHIKIPKIPQNRIRITLMENVLAAMIAKDRRLKTSLMDTADENALALASDLNALIYGRLSGNGQNLTVERELYFSINVHYQRLLAFMRRDGSFGNFASGNWNNLDGTIWLTAQCLGLIQTASAYKKIDYIWIDSTIIEANLNWLLQQQTPEGNWQQRGTTTEESKTKLTLTAHVVATLCSLKNFTSDVPVEKAITNGLNWIEENWRARLNTADPYEVALTTYALLLCKSPIGEDILPILHGLVRRTKEPYLYWASEDWEKTRRYTHGHQECSSSVVETTSYALMIYLLRGDTQMEAIANWLNSNCLYEQGLISARAKSAAMSALLEYYSHTRTQGGRSMTVELLAPSISGEALRETLYLNITNGGRLQSFEFHNVIGTLEMKAKGTGSGVIHVHFDTDEDKVAQSSSTPAFRITNKAKYHGHQGSHLSYSTCIKWIHSQQPTNRGLTILDVTLPTGYGIEQQLLDAYARSKNVKQLLRAKYMDTNIIFYFKDLSQENTCVEFTIKRWYPVANMTRFLPLRVYNYHAPEHFALTIFDALPLHRLNITEALASSHCVNCLPSSSSTIVISLEIFCLDLIFFFALCRLI